MDSLTGSLETTTWKKTRKINEFFFYQKKPLLEKKDSSNWPELKKKLSIRRIGFLSARAIDWYDHTFPHNLLL
ncbi:hypothetical protein DSECCO2_334220 [anaerobic digester metagenome]